MNYKSKLIISLLFAINILTIGSLFFSMAVNAQADSPKIAGLTAGYKEGYTPPKILTRFPVDLDLLYYNVSHPEAIKDRIDSYGMHQYKAHIDGNHRWYLMTANTPLQIPFYAPAQSQFTSIMAAGGREEALNFVTFEGKTCYENVRLELKVSKDINVVFDHAYVLKSIIDKVETNKTFYAGEMLGYGSKGGFAGELDFEVNDANYHNGVSSNRGTGVCPLAYFDASIQTEILNWWNTYDYEWWKEQGTLPQGHLCNDPNINIPGTIWGIWKDVSDPNFEKGNTILTTLERSRFITEETLNQTESGKPLPTTYIGILGQRNPNQQDTTTDLFGSVVIERVNGDNVSGIFKCTEFQTDVKKQYIRYEVTPGSDSATGYDDRLVIEGFDTLVAAEAGFTEAKLEYIHDFSYGREEEGDIGIETSPLFIGLFSLGTIGIIIQKRKNPE